MRTIQNGSFGNGKNTQRIEEEDRLEETQWLESKVAYSELTESWLTMCNMDCPECQFRSECDSLNESGLEDSED